MRLYNTILSTMMLAVAATSCDDGKIYDETLPGSGDAITSTVKFTGDVQGLDSDRKSVV